MKNNCVTLLLLGLLSGAAYAQGQTPVLLKQAAQCLAAKKQLPTSGAALSLGSWIDTTSYPGKKVLYVVATSGTNHSAGKVFAIFFLQGRHRQIFDIQNGAIFVQSNDGKGNINFVGPPVGGEAAEGPFVTAIQHLEGQPRFTISGAELLAPLAHTTCKSYTDNDQP